MLCNLLQTDVFMWLLHGCRGLKHKLSWSGSWSAEKLSSALNDTQVSPLTLDTLWFALLEGLVLFETNTLPGGLLQDCLTSTHALSVTTVGVHPCQCLLTQC